MSLQVNEAAPAKVALPAPPATATALALAATLGGFLFGYDTAVISGAVAAIDANFIDPRGLPETAADSLAGWTVSSALLGCVIGGALAGWAANAMGRRGGMMLAATLFIVSSLGSAFPEAIWGATGAGALGPFVGYRILGGVGIGLASMLSPLYIAEIAPPSQRGRLVSYNQMAIVLGIVGVYFVNWGIAALGDDTWVLTTGWRYMLASAAIPALAFLLLLIRAPDSPRWLVMKGRHAEARAVLNRVAGPEEAELVLAEIRDSLSEHSGKLFSFGMGVVAIGLTLSAFQQLVGINAVLYYAPEIFRNMGASSDSALLQTVLVGSVNVVFTLVAIFTVDRFGRKPLLIAGALVMATAMAALGTLFHLHALGVGALVAMLVYVAGFAMSWGPVVWVLLSEMFPNPIKGKAMAIAVAVQWLANLVVSWSFKVIDGDSVLIAAFNHGFAYWLYAAASLLAALFVIRFIPETKGKTLEAIGASWRGK
ncbi:D-xylose transporter XylE [Phenylobacterium sp.]|uniref:D-xylose transporter XylE n=1 Tax=Phenylobacterium sp. TaxID=1871053 RepID=UPI002FC99B2C